MKVNKIKIIIFICLIPCIFVNPQAVNIYMPQYLNVNEKSFPVSPSAKDYGVGITHGILCSIPKQVSDVFKSFTNTIKGKLGLAGFLDAGFSIVLSLFGISTGPDYVTREFLDQRLEQLFLDVQLYVENRIDAENFVFSQIQYSKLRSPLQNFKDLQTIMAYEINTTGVVSIQTKKSIIGVYWILITQLEQATIELGHISRIHETGLLFLETSILYATALKDGMNYGNQMGLPKYLINETTGSNALLSKKFDDLRRNVLEKWPQMINSVLEIRSLVQDLNERKKYKTSISRNVINQIPSKGEFVSIFHYANPDLYPNPIYFVNYNNLTSGLVLYANAQLGNLHLGYNLLNLDAPIGSIYVIDSLLTRIGIGRLGGYEQTLRRYSYVGLYVVADQERPFKYIDQKNDFLTGLNGYLNDNSSFHFSYSLLLKFQNEKIKKSLYFRLIYTSSKGPDYPKFVLNFYDTQTANFITPANKQQNKTLQLTENTKHVEGRYMLIIGPYDFSNQIGDVIIEVKPYNGFFAFIALEIIT